MMELRYKKYGEERKMIFVGWDDVFEKVEDKNVEKDSIEVYEDEVLIWSE
jgi:hypothetical protein